MAANIGVQLDVNRALGNMGMAASYSVRDARKNISQMVNVMNNFTDGTDFTTLAAMLGGITTAKAQALYTTMVNANTALTASAALNLVADALSPLV